MWTVSVLLEAERYKPSMLNASEQMLTHLNKTQLMYNLANTDKNSLIPQLLNVLSLVFYLLTPRRNSKSFCPSGMEKTRMTVPWGRKRNTQGAGWEEEANTKITLCSDRQQANASDDTFSEAVASLVPLASNAKAAKGLSWAGIMLAALWGNKTHRGLCRTEWSPNRTGAI